ncbi:MULTISPECIES: hypothetical protein [Actinomadura]|uniref:Uncharacterized protein n=1 Tax=Actinomadura madurae TaxID=1993 RepID=A0A1I4X3P2_9ACTN|nr:hypothetical protein [Actinomadura madurae]SFN20255.1 hypothetical protein SAMN04489713_101660 [Actinomadura madurae]SPT63279.1 Uncharacterised protein [Actinomadura madurae]
MAAPPPPGSLPPPLTGTAAAELSPTERPNPEYQQLYQAYADAYGSIDRLRRALDAPVKTLRGTDAWLGPEAREWGGHLDANRGALRKAADRILWDIYDRLSATQRTIARV